MKLLAHSVVPPAQVPYLHLGYTSAYAMKQTSQPPGYVFLVSGAFLAIVMGVVLLRRRVRFARGWLLAGVVVLALAQIPWPSRYADPELTSHDFAWKAYHKIRVMRKPGEPLPADLRSFARKNGISSTDGWRREMRIMLLSEQGNDVYAVVSAGHDARFGTPDDIAVTEGSSPFYSRKRPLIELPSFDTGPDAGAFPRRGE